MNSLSGAWGYACAWLPVCMCMGGSGEFECVFECVRVCMCTCGVCGGERLDVLVSAGGWCVCVEGLVLVLVLVLNTIH